MKKILLWIIYSFILLVADYVSCECPEPSQIEHGYICNTNDTLTYEVGDMVTYCCDEEYIISGTESITCTVNQTWENELPQCTSNGFVIAIHLIVILSIFGSLLLICLFIIIVVCVGIYARRRSRISRIDRYLNMLRDTESLEESSEHVQYNYMNEMNVDEDNRERDTVTNRSYKTPMRLAWGRYEETTN